MQVLQACGGGGGQAKAPASIAQNVLPVTLAASPAPLKINRSGFLGAFFRPQGPPPFGIFASNSPGVAPAPYPTPGTQLFGPAGYCDAIAANGKSISSGNLVDSNKLANIVDLGVKWTRTDPSPQFDDLSHLFGAGAYAFGDFDAAQCALERNGITPVVGLDAGPVEYSATPGSTTPVLKLTYQSAAEFGQWCAVVVAHEKAVFPDVTRFSLPGNEVDSNPTVFPGGNAQIAAYAQACYAAVKSVNPAAFVYGFELNMDGNINVPAFITALAALGCRAGTCYDGIGLHLSMAYPIPGAAAPCYPSAGGQYDLACVSAVEAAAGVTHVLVSETAYSIPRGVPDEATKALAVVAEFNSYFAEGTIDGVLYANVDECGFYLTGAFVGACLVNTAGQQLPAYSALQQLAKRSFQ